MAVHSEGRVRQVLTHLAKAKVGNEPRFLFRGQTNVYQSVPAFIGRLTNPIVSGTAYTILRRLIGQLRGQIARIPQLVAPDADETIALMQHYGWPTPFLDLTDSVDVAFFFAKYNPAMVGSNLIPSPAIIYALDTRLLPNGCRHVRHDDVVDPTLNLRWTKQRGHALAATGWPNMQHVRALDLLHLPGLKVFHFQPNGFASQNDEAEYLPPLDAVADQLAFLVGSLAESIELKPLPQVLARFPF